MIKIRDVVKRYPSPEGGEITVLTLPKLDIHTGEEVGIAGASGTGKTTLLHIVSGILAPSQGSVSIGDVEITLLPEAKRDLFRARNIGYVFQAFNLIPSLSAQENVMTSMVFGKKIPAREREDRCRELLKRVGLFHRMHHRPAQLSGGEQQRVSIARALANKPPVFIADEPTANLDLKNRIMVMEILREVCRENGITLLLSSHDQEVLKSLKRVVSLQQRAEEVEENAAAYSLA